MFRGEGEMSKSYTGAVKAKVTEIQFAQMLKKAINEGKAEEVEKVLTSENAKVTPAERAANKGFPGIKTTENGGPDFAGTEYLYPVEGEQKNIVTIKMTGSRKSDFKEANELALFPDAGDGSPSKDYTWHHLDDYNPETGTCTMQLVNRNAHEKTKPHKGACAQYDDYQGKKIYNPPKKKNPKI